MATAYSLYEQMASESGLCRDMFRGCAGFTVLPFFCLLSSPLVSSLTSSRVILALATEREPADAPLKGYPDRRVIAADLRLDGFPVG